jgi:hypothetical protein
VRSLILKDLEVESLKINDLGCQRALKMGLGQLRGPSWLTDPPRNCPNQISIVTHCGSYVNGFRAIRWSHPSFAKKREGLHPPHPRPKV